VRNISTDVREEVEGALLLPVWECSENGTRSA
jgi:hypothetical protein